MKNMSVNGCSCSILQKKHENKLHYLHITCAVAYNLDKFKSKN